MAKMRWRELFNTLKQVNNMDIILKPFRVENNTNYYRVDFAKIKKEEMYRKINCLLNKEKYEPRALVFSSKFVVK